MNTITCKLDENQRKKLYNLFKETQTNPNNQYIEFQLKPENAVITAYTSGKVVFSGKDAHIYASPYETINKKSSNNSTTNITSKTIDTGSLSTAGSDEVGTGDYFGPVCVCAVVLIEKDIDFVKSLRVDDSKKITDKLILEIAPSLMDRLTYSLLILDNPRYNKVQETNNLNAIKAKLHNQAYINLAKKCELPPLCIIDQFAPEQTYYRYLTKEKQVFKNLHFETKAESKYLSVACASIIARYGFLMAYKSIEEHYDMTLTKGAGVKVDEDAVKFVKKYGMSELTNVAKLHFKNTDTLKSKLK